MIGILDPAPCAGCGFDARSVAPGDAAVALRSYPRRFRVLLTGLDEKDEVLSLERPAPDAWSAAEHAASAAAVFARATEALGRVTTTEAPAVSLDAGEPRAMSVDDVVGALTTAAEGLAAATGNVKGTEWTRVGTVDGHPVTALQVVQYAVHAGHHELRDVERVLSALRHDTGRR